jgi:hypothetical protein
MKKIVIWIMIGVVVIGLGVALIQTELIPIFQRLAKEVSAEDELSIDKESEKESNLPDEQPVEMIASDDEFVSSVLWCRDEFGRLYNIVEFHPSNEMDQLITRPVVVNFWYRDESGRLHKVALEVEPGQPSVSGGIWYRDETGRLHKAMTEVVIEQPLGAGEFWYRDETGRFHKVTAKSELGQTSSSGGIWYRDEAGRFHKSLAEADLDQPADSGGIWYRDEAGRLFKMNASDQE